MGFRFKRFDYTGGVAPWTGGTLVAEQIVRSKVVCKDIADFIISCSKGWSLDARNQTTSDFVDVPVWDKIGTVQSFYAPGLFFVNQNGCKLFLCVAGFSSEYGIALDKEYCLQDVPVTRINYTGIIMSMIPSGSSNSFGTIFDSTFLPSDATPICGTIGYINPQATDRYNNCIALNTNGYGFVYGILVDSYCVGIGGGWSPSGGKSYCFPGYFVGRVLGSLAHDSDALPQARYGVIKFGDSYNESRTNSGLCEILNGCYSTFLGETNVGVNFLASVTTSMNKSDLQTHCCGCFFKANGTLVDGRNGSNVRYFAHTKSCLSSNSLIENDASTGYSRWVPFEAGIASNSLPIDGVVAGDGFKGYLDTELFRAAVVTDNSYYANKSFIGWLGIGPNWDLHFLVGWEADNTEDFSIN